MEQWNKKITQCKWLTDVCQAIKTHIIVLRYRFELQFRDNIYDFFFFWGGGGGGLSIYLTLN